MKILRLAVAVMIACAGRREPARPIEPVVALSLDMTADAIVSAIRAEANRLHLPPDCFFLWGDLRDLPSSARAMTLTWPSSSLTGATVCGEDAETVMRGPLVREVGLVRFRAHRLEVGHPSDTSEWRAIETADETSESRARALALFTPDGNVPGREMLPVLARLPRAFRLVMWPIG